MDDSLSSESFYQGAKKAAHKAMDDHGRAEYDEFALHAGVAVERLAKAVLVSKNPTYIAEIRNADMMLYLGGHLQMDEKNIRTVGAKDAIARLRKIGVLQGDPQLDLLIEMRNGAAHASTDSDQAKGMISPLAGTIETLLSDLGKTTDTFWERWTDAVKAAVDEQGDQAFRDVQLRIAQARHAFDDRFLGLPPEVKQQALKAPQPRENEWYAHPMVIKKDDAVVLVVTGGECPACTGPALLTFEPIRRDGPKTTYIPNGFGCFLCGFEANGPEEMAAVRAIAGGVATPTLQIPEHMAVGAEMPEI
ncbi:hypothetical protein ACFW2D_09900 [Streptomyces sp. NPDC058914]|uniref:hypothetical protein n=1 Tax=Streptomyces sp. NPDC058914 TaxID=3346671 RepID=UPI0036821E43